MFRILTSGLMAVSLCGCLVTPDLTTGEDCWRYGVVEGKVTRRLATHIIRLNKDDLVRVCEQHAWGCYYHRIIYLHYGAGLMDENHEKCHSNMPQMEHNNCTGYGIGKDATACDWNEASR